MRALADPLPPASSSSTHRAEGNTAQAEPFHVSAAKVNGAPTRRPGRAPRHDYAALLPQALSEGAKLESVAACLGVTHTVVHKHAHRLGLGHLTPKARRSARVMDLFSQGFSLPEIAAQVGCCTDTVRLIAKRAGRYDRAVEHRNTGVISRQERAALRGAPPGPPPTAGGPTRGASAAPLSPGPVGRPVCATGVSSLTSLGSGRGPFPSADGPGAHGLLPAVGAYSPTPPGSSAE